MSDDIFDSEDDSFNEKEERPIFLTVLIVLTWLAVASTVSSSAFSLANSGNAAEQMEQSMAMFDQIPNDNPIISAYMDDFKDFFEVAIQNMVPLNLSNLILYLIEGFAALLMFNLKKVGLWLYIACQVGFVMVFYIFYPSNNIMTTITLISAVIFSLLFSILYGVNAKHLKN